MSDQDERTLTLEDLLGPIPESADQEEEARESSTSASSAGYVYRESDSYKLSSPSPPKIESPSVSDKNPSKSQRIRSFLEANPDARNRDVVESLGEYGITAADVSNAKAQLKRKGAPPAKRGRPSAEATAAKAAAATSSSVDAAGNTGQIGINEIEAALGFVRQMGSLDRAQQLLVIIQQIQHL